MGTQPENTHGIQTQTQPNPYPNFGLGPGITLGYPNFGYPILAIVHTVYLKTKTLHANKMKMNEQWMAKHKWQKLHFSRYMQKKGSLTQNKLFSSITILDGLVRNTAK